MIQQNVSPNASTGIAPALAAPSRGLNDDFLLDDTNETKEPTIRIPAFKPSAPGEIPEESDTVDLIAAAEQFQQEAIVAQEELNVTLRDLDLLRDTIRSTGGMNTSIALECSDIIPNFINEDVRPMGFFTVKTSKTMLKESLEAIALEEEKANTGFKEKMKALYEKFMAWLSSVKNRIEKMFTKKNASQKIDEFQKAKSGAPKTDDAAMDALINKYLKSLDDYIHQDLGKDTLAEAGESSDDISIAIAHFDHWKGFNYFASTIQSLQALERESVEEWADNFTHYMEYIEPAIEILENLNKPTKVTDTQVLAYVAKVTNEVEYLEKIKDGVTQVQRLTTSCVSKLKDYDGSDISPVAAKAINEIITKILEASRNAIRALPPIHATDSVIARTFEYRRRVLVDEFQKELHSSDYKDKGAAMDIFLDKMYAKRATK